MVNPPALIAAMLTALAIGALLWKLENWWVHWQSERFVARLIANPPNPGERPKLDPESKYVVEFGPDTVTCTCPKGKAETVTWSELQMVAILTTGVGPFLPDIFWVLYGEQDGCVIPWGATGEPSLLKRLQSLPGFRNDAIVSAVSLTDENHIVCWQRTAA